MSNPENVDPKGLAAGATAYVIWGLLPLYFALLADVPDIEIVAHRVLWSFVLCVVLVAATSSWPRLRNVLANRRAVALLAGAGVLVTSNWLAFVYAVNSGNTVDASLGYFINPIITVALAVVVLGERLRRTQWFALAFSTAAVLVIWAGYGKVPWIALFLATSFALYGLVKNRVGRTVAAIDSLTIETATVTPIAAAFIGYLIATGQTQFTTRGPGFALLLLAAGLVTGVPLLLFGEGARRIPLRYIGLLQYITPILQFLVGVVVFGEEMPPARWAGFVLVWIAVVILVVDGLRGRRDAERARQATTARS